MINAISKSQELRVLLALVANSGGRGAIDFESTPMSEQLGEVIANGNVLTELLVELDRRGVIQYEMVGEEGFAPIIVASTTHATHTYMAELACSLEEDYQKLRARIAEMLTFDPGRLSTEIEEARKQLAEAEGLIRSNELLKPLERPLRLIQLHFASIGVVCDNYDDVYKNIVRPVQAAGESGIKATKIWAVAGILASSAVSIALNYWAYDGAVEAAALRTAALNAVPKCTASTPSMLTITQGRSL